MRKGMAYRRKRQIDKMTMEEFRALDETERLLYWRTPMPQEQVARIFKEMRQRQNDEPL